MWGRFDWGEQQQEREEAGSLALLGMERFKKKGNSKSNSKSNSNCSCSCNCRSLQDEKKM
jgi:hypothetical protein